MTLLVATRNPGKLKEIRGLLEPHGIEVLGLEAVAAASAVEEDGETFLENARKKACSLCQATGLPALADDSGLAVWALGGLPGVRSARYAGPGASDAENNRKLLREMETVPEGQRSAAFLCAMVLALPGGGERAAEGRLGGQILREPRGSEGFGYDPLFLVDGAGKTLAEMGLAEKNRLSHRARALEALTPSLLQLLGRRPGNPPERLAS